MRYMVLGLLALSGAAAAQEGRRREIADARAGGAPQRIRSVNLLAGEKCPPSTADEVVVCYQGGSPYRIPPQLRRDPNIPAANQSWVNRTAVIDQVSRVAGGLPNTCSAVGTGGQTGCAGSAFNSYAAERREREREARIVPGGE